MSETLERGAAAFLARYQGIAGQLPGDRAWRDRAARRFGEIGLPGPRDEDWKYTSLRAVAEQRFHEALTEVAGGRGRRMPALPPLPALPRLVFVEGRYDADLSAPPTGLAFRRFALDAQWAGLAAPDEQPLVALNTMLAEDGAILDVAPGTDAGTVLLVSLGGDLAGTAIDFHPRHAIRLGEGARLTLIEIATGEGAYLHNPVTEIRLAAGAVCRHVRLQEESRSAFHLATTYLVLGEGADYDGFTLNLGARTGRSEFHVELAGRDASVTLDAAQALGGSQHGDVTSAILHATPHCRSRQTVRNVLSGRARGVFQGRIEVARGAQKTDGYQMNQALLLSPEAEMDSKPQLRIFADDVRCSHGATIGELDAEQLFYLRSRGIPAAEARRILVRAFLDAAIDNVGDEMARGLLGAALDRALAEAA